MSGVGRQLCPCQCHWDWSWLCFDPPKIAVSDVDFIVERRGHFLYIETKGIRPDGEHERLDTGQRILIEQLSYLPRFTVLLVYGHGEPEFVQRVIRGQIGEPIETDKTRFQAYVERWNARANGNAL